MTPSAPAAEARTLTIPITGGRIALLQTPGEVTENDFKFLQTYLTLMKDAIITGTVSPASSNEAI